MYKETNKTALKSQKRILEALFELMEQEEYNNITVKNICKKADISRQTFYYLFESKDEIVIYYLNIFFEELEQYINDSQIISLYDLIYNYFYAIDNNINIKKFIFIPNITPIFINISLKFMANMHFIKTTRQAGKDESYAHYFLSFGLHGIFLLWEENKDITLKNLVSIKENILQEKVFE